MARWHPSAPSSSQTKSRRNVPPCKDPQMRALRKLQVPYIREGDGWVYHCVEVVQRGRTCREIIAKIGGDLRQFAERMLHLALRAAGYRRARFAKRCSCGRRHREFVKVGPNGSLDDIEKIVRRCLKKIGEGDAPQ
ncbi:hypothetical protein B0H14DRAFT_3492164 [Mycena olivaceomarginata]|nr:hypothetical protein B0H14DRAFT_3492164 [Mycena olivaceomarginata]